jgi:hypothetical protein
MALAPHFVLFSEGAQFVEWRASSSVPGCAALIRMAAVGYPTSSVAPLRPVTVARCRTVRDLPPPSRTVAAPNSFQLPVLPAVRCRSHSTPSEASQSPIGPIPGKPRLNWPYEISGSAASTTVFGRGSCGHHGTVRLTLGLPQ